MAQTKGFVKVLQLKVVNITSQKDQLHGVLDDYVHRMTSKAGEMLGKEEQDVETLKDLLFTMDSVLGYLFDITTQMEDVPTTTAVETSDQLSTQASSSSLLSSTLPQLSSATLPTKSHDSAESQEVPKLQYRMEVLEIALTTCRNEISQANTDKNEVRDKLDKLENHIQKVETSHLHELDQKEERLASLENLTQQTQSNMTKEIKDLQKNFKEQTSKLGKVEKKLKKMKEVEQERWSQIDSIHTDVESLKDDQRDNQQLVKIQGLEKYMETLTSQCDSLQDQVGKIEPVMQMSQELANKISTVMQMSQEQARKIFTLATDKQVQELIQATTATSRSLEELTSRVEVTERSVRGWVAQRERDENRGREMEDRVAVLETQKQKDLDHYTKELKKTNSSLDDVVKKVEDISTQLDKLERSVVPARVGFTAYRPKTPLPSTGSHITDFTNVLCNEGNHYNMYTGEFICPLDGLYVVSATLFQFDDGDVFAKIMCQSVNSATPPTHVCLVYTNQAMTSDCGVGVVSLKTGDRVYVEVGFSNGHPRVNDTSSFSCVLIA